MGFLDVRTILKTFFFFSLSTTFLSSCGVKIIFIFHVPFLLYCFLGFNFHCVSGSQKLCIVLHKIQAYNSHLFHIQYNCCDTFFLFFGHIFHLPFRYFVLTFLVTFPILVLQGTDMPEYVERGKIIWHLFHHHFKMIFQI